MSEQGHRSYSALSKIELSNDEQLEIWSQIEDRINNAKVKVTTRRRPLWGATSAAVAAIAVVVGVSYSLVHRSTSRTTNPHPVVASKQQLPKFPAISQIQSISVSAGTEWIAGNPKPAEQDIHSWLSTATLYTGNVPKTNASLDNTYVGIASLLLQTVHNAEIVISPANHIVLRNGEYTPVYIHDVVVYSEGTRSVYLKSARLYDWLKNNKWENEFAIPKNPLFRVSLTLPNGKKITPNHSAKWKDIIINLQITGVPEHSPRYLEVVGNHSTVMSHETVSTSAGKATLVLNKRTPPAASKSTTPTYEYWVIVYRTQYSYAIEATFTGSAKQAKSEVMALLKRWNVPK